MSAQKKFDCVDMKNTIQASREILYAGLTDKERIVAMRNNIQSNGRFSRFLGKHVYSENHCNQR